MNTLTTELEAVNTMLSTIGETPVNTLEDSGVVDVVLAKQILNTVNRRAQTRGWHFNLEKGFELTPSEPSKNIVIPANTLRVDTVGGDQGVDVVQRGLRLYDRVEHTYRFDKTLKVDLIVFLPFEELPEAAREYITIRAARIFQEQTVGSQELTGFTLREEQQALATLKEFNGDTADYNILTGSYAVSRILER